MIKIRLKCLSRILLLVFSILLLTFIGTKPINSVLAEDSSLPTISVINKTVHRGQTFEVDVNMDSNPGILTMVLQLDYNKEVMSLVGVERGNALSSLTFTTTNPDTEEGYLIDNFKFLWDGTKQDTSTGTLVKLKFESKLEAPVGKYPITITYEKENTTIEHKQPIELNITNGEVTLTTGAFKVVYKNYDGSILQKRDYNSGATPSYTGSTPKRPADEKYSYKFVGWKGEVSNEANTICYVAQYSTTPQEYQVIFYVDGEYFAADIYGYNEYLDLTIAPKKKNHNFSGWHLDENYTQKVSTLKMPSYNIVLYGYMKYNIREENIPEITMKFDKMEDDIAYVNVNLTSNSGLSGLVLTLDYDRSTLELVGLDQGEIFKNLQFSHTNTDTKEGYNIDPFKIYWEGLINNYETGKLVTLKFKIKPKVQPGIYNVSVTYNEESDAVFFNDEGELWYTKISILNTVVPYGKINNWVEESDLGIVIDITTDVGLSPETILVIERVTQNISLTGDQVIAAAGEGMELKDVYSVKLMLNGEEIDPGGKITVKIELTDEQLRCRTIKVFNLDENKLMKKYSSNVKEGFVVFETEKLSNFAIVGNVVSEYGTQIPTNTSILIISLSLLVIAVMGLVLIIKAKTRKKK